MQVALDVEHDIARVGSTVMVLVISRQRESPPVFPSGGGLRSGGESRRIRRRTAWAHMC
jgi:hypothetical protein